MILADKIINLRKKANMTQEDLASEIGVSRQSISKWESQMAMPDLDKIMKLSKIFGVSTDFLLNDDMGIEQIVVDEVHEDVTKVIDVPMLNDYFATYEKIAKKVAMAVPLFILSPIPTIALENANEKAGIMLTIMIIAIAVAMLIAAGFESSKFEFIEKEPYNFSYGVEGIIQKNINEYTPTVKRNMIISIAIFILSPMMFLLVEGSDFPEAYILILFLFMTAIAVAIIGYTMTKYTTMKEIMEYRDPRKQQKDNNMGKASGILWILTLAVFLAYSFVTGNWHNSWIIFVIAGFIQLALAVYFDK